MSFKYTYAKYIFLIGLISLLSSCRKSTTSTENILYSSDFEDGSLKQISNGVISIYNGTKCLGNYNQGGFLITLNDIPEHKLLKISFDLYIMDSWDGNKSSPDGPDIWSLKVGNSMIIYTTFANQPCSPGDLCSPQSYPLNYPNFNNNPKSGASVTGLPGMCGITGTTTLYHIEKLVEHSSRSVVAAFEDRLIQTNSADPKCDESWAVDNLTIKAVKL